jgi:hypothetical protein
METSVYTLAVGSVVVIWVEVKLEIGDFDPEFAPS